MLLPLERTLYAFCSREAVPQDSERSEGTHATPHAAAAERQRPRTAGAQKRPMRRLVSLLAGRPMTTAASWRAPGRPEARRG